MLDEMDALVAADPVSYLHPGKRWEYPWALERAGLEPGARVPDVGSGDSIFPIYLARRGHRVSEVDRDRTRPAMRDYDGYPYTSVGVTLRPVPRTPGPDRSGEER